MIDTGQTVMKCTTLLKALKANRVFVFVTHGVFGGNFYQNLKDCKEIDGLYCTDSLPVKDSILEESCKLKRISLSPLIEKWLNK